MQIQSKGIFLDHCRGCAAWNNGKSGAKLVLTSSTTPGLQIHKFDHSRTANPCDWLLCRRAALPLVGCPHSIVYLHLPVVEGLIFCISATPHLGTSFPLFHAPRRSLLCSWSRCQLCRYLPVFSFLPELYLGDTGQQFEFWLWLVVVMDI